MSDHAHLVYALQLENHGPIESQEQALLNEVELIFSDPSKWPLTDVERVEFVKRLAKMVSDLIRTRSAKIWAEQATTKGTQ